jgi:diguanylate cyclase (GGDEF)-like protein
MTRGRASRLTVLVAVVGGLGAAALAASGAVVAGHGLDGVVPRHLLLVAVATLFTDATWVNLRIGHDVESYTWAELNLTLALAWLAPEHIVLTAMCVGAAYAVTGRSPVKVLFNTTSYAFGVGLAAVVAHAIATPSWDDPVRSGLAIGAGVLAFTAWNGASVNAAIAFSQDLPFRPVFMKGAGLRLLVAAGNLAAGLSLLGLAHLRPDALWLAPVALGLAFAVYHGFLRVVQDRAAWRQLELTGKEVTRLDEREVAQAALARATRLFDADEAELVLRPADGSGPSRVYLGNSAGTATVLRSEQDEEPSFTVATYQGDGRHARETCVAVPLVRGESRLGTLRVRFFAAVRLSARERHLLDTFAATVAASIENARLFAQVQAESARHETAARHDHLTGLPNRLLFEDRVRTALTHRRRANGFAVLLIDLDRFKEVNDSLGHAAGDAVLREVAARLRRAVRPQDTVSRLGGDEFAVLLDDASAAEATAERLSTLLVEPMHVHGVTVQVGGSIGFACYPQDGIAYEDLVRRADVAMYQAKQAGAFFRRYDPARDRTVMEGLNLVDELRAALEGGQLELHFQPQIDLRSGLAVGAEAFVRWRHPTRGLLAPASFLSTLEASNLMRQFTCRVLDMAVAECAAWRRAGRELTVSVNLSARNFEQGPLADDVADALFRHRLPASLLTLEVAEAALPTNLELLEAHVAQLADIGVRVSIDDFGNGHLSLSALRRMHVREVKLDAPFVNGITSSEDDAAIAEATIHLAHSLGVRIVAEGVEEPRVLARLMDLGCDGGQGYHWGRPVPADEVRPLLGVPAAQAPASSSTTR